MSDQQRRAVHFLETVLVLEDGSIPLLREHYDRYAANHHISPPINIEEFAALLLSVAREKQRQRCRLIYGGDGRVMELSAQLFVPRTLGRVGRIDLPGAAYSRKFADRRLFDRLRERFPEYDEIIITKRGFLSDGTFSNLYVRRPPATPSFPLLTPSHNLLAGCRRERLIKDGRLHPRPLLWAELEPEWRIGFINALNPPGQLGEFAAGEIDDLATST